ncbi:MAG TPA: CHAT domain-containing protein [Thermoanaerobaculia bacterium]|jgi:CHAT domain-containing protein/Tfp pilus assembly protein PilF|nr:CHAT domain-containing protein [Thermoanaerobaculia bacterium]
MAAPALLGDGAEGGETLLPGQSREQPIAGGETRGYRVEVTSVPLLVKVEQLGIDLVVQAQGPTARLVTDTGDFRCGFEVLLLESAGEHRIEIHPRERSTAPGRFVIEVEALPASSDGQRRAAWSLMSRAGQEAFERNPEAGRRAVGFYRAALGLWRALGDRRWEAETLSLTAGLEQDAGELQVATESHLHAAALWQELGDRSRQAATLNRLGVTYLQSGEIVRARETLANALAMWQRLGQSFDEMETRSNLCYLEQMTGGLPKALACYEETRGFFHQTGDVGQEARIFNNIGGVYDLLGEPDAALEHYEQALALRRALADHRGEAETLNNIAVIHRVLGEWQEALRIYEQEREVLTTLDDRILKGKYLSNLGFSYNSMGLPQRGRPLLENALELRQQVGDRRGEIITLNNLGSVWRNLGDPGKAIQLHRQARELAVAQGDSRQEAISRLRLGEAQLDRGDATAALGEIDSALSLFQATGSRRNEVQMLDLRGRALILAGRPQEAVTALQAALGLHRTLRDRAGEAEALRALSTAERSIGQLTDARTHAEEAVSRVEELRIGFLSPDLRAAFLATQHSAYALVMDLLMDEGKDRAAFEMSERARARSLLDVLYRGTVRGVASSAPAELLARRQALHHRLSAKTDQQLKQSGTRAEALERDINTLMAELDGVEARIRRLDSHYAALATPPALNIEEISRLLDPETLLLEYSLGEDRSYLWAISVSSFRSVVLPSQRKIEALTRQLYEEMNTLDAGQSRRTHTAEALSAILLAPVWPDAARFRRLVVVPDAALQVLPFGALPTPSSGEPLLELHEIDYIPSATTLALQRKRLADRTPGTKWAAVLADPIFAMDDPRLVKKMNSVRGSETEDIPPTFERLPASGHEAQEIAKLAPPDKVRILLAHTANRNAMLSGELRDYRVLHLATHAIANTHSPELSGLVLSLVDAAGTPEEGFLGLSDIYDLDLSADLVVLSGCQTALGKEIRGEGIMGLTRGFFFAGVPRVVASLWRVQDHATAELMARFYRELWRKQLPPAAALREAQRSLRRDPRYRDPYFWAGFVLQGDWR